MRLGGGRDFVYTETHGDGLGRMIIPDLALAGLQRKRLDGAHAVNGFDKQRLPSPSAL
jgi:hypothetical protein